MRLSFNILFLGCWFAGQQRMSSEQDLPKPSISVSPSHVVALGGNVSIHCKSECYRQMEFYLLKEGSNVVYADSLAEGYDVTFPIVNASAEDGGVYQCQYHPPTEPKRWSAQSNKIDIHITDPSLSKPSIKLHGEPAVGMNVTIECWGPKHGLIFSLHKSRSLTPTHVVQPAGDRTYFHFHMLKLEDAGSYTCQYHYKRKPFVWSGPSDSVELVLADRTILWASCGAGLLLLILLLLLLVFLFYRRRERGSAAEKRTQPLTTDVTNTIPESDAEADPDGVAYAVLNHQPLKTKQEANPVKDPESCVYASVAKDRARKGQ